MDDDDVDDVELEEDEEEDDDDDDEEDDDEPLPLDPPLRLPTESSFKLFRQIGHVPCNSNQGTMQPL